MGAHNGRDQFNKWISIINESDFVECGMANRPYQQHSSMTINTNISTDAGKSVSITANGDAADELLKLLKMAGMQSSEYSASMIEGELGCEEDLLLPTKGSCGCQSWDCEICFPHDNLPYKHNHGVEPVHHDKCDMCGHGLNSPLHELECAMKEELINDKGEESPLTFGDKNLGESGIYEEESREVQIEEILGLQMLGFSQSEKNYNEQELLSMSDDEFNRVCDEVRGEYSEPAVADQDAADIDQEVEKDIENNNDQLADQPTDQEKVDEVDQDILEWNKRLSRG
jgi:hypothetical protein